MKRKNMPDMVAGNRIARRLSALKQATYKELTDEIKRRNVAINMNMSKLSKYETGEEMPPKDY